MRWTDQALPEPLDVTAVYQVTLDDLTLGAPGSPARLKALVQAPPIADRVEISGNLFTDPARQGADLSMEVTGISARPLAGYLPAGIAPGLDRGELHLGVLGLIESAPQGHQVTFQVRDLDLRETGAPEALLHMDRFRTFVSRLDPNAVTVDECSIQGLEARVERADPSSLSLLGLRLCSGSEIGSPVSPGGGLGTPQPAVQTDRPAATERTRLATYPDVTVKTLDLQARKIAWIDHVLAGAAPLSIEDLRIHSTSPWQMQGQSPQDSTPLHLEAAARVCPIVDDLQVHAQVAPFAEEPNLTVDVAVHGIRGSGLTQVRPDLADLLDGSKLQAGHLTGHVQAVLDVPRRNPFDYNLRRPFGLSLRLTDLQVTEGNDPSPLAGLSQLSLEIPSVDIANRRATVKRIEVIKPQCRLVRDPNGVRVLDMIVRSASRSRDPNAVRAPTDQAPGPAVGRTGRSRST